MWQAASTQMLYYLLSASGVIILSIITITIRLLVRLQALPCPSTGKLNSQWRALWIQAIPKLLCHPINLLNESVRCYALQRCASLSDSNIVSIVQP